MKTHYVQYQQHAYALSYFYGLTCIVTNMLNFMCCYIWSTHEIYIIYSWYDLLVSIKDFIESVCLCVSNFNIWVWILYSAAISGWPSVYSKKEIEYYYSFTWMSNLNIWEDVYTCTCLYVATYVVCHSWIMHVANNWLPTLSRVDYGNVVLIKIAV